MSLATSCASIQACSFFAGRSQRSRSTAARRAPVRARRFGSSPRLALLDTLRNDTNGGWRQVGSAGLKNTFTVPTDINGRTINGVQLGVVHRF